MFEEYIFDSYVFLTEAKNAPSEDKKKQIRAYRVSILLAASSLEAFINYLGEAFRDNLCLTLHERDFLNDVQSEVNPKNGSLTTREKYQTIENKIRFLIAKFEIEFDYANSPYWSQFKELKSFRDKLVHPRDSVSAFELEDYQINAERGLQVSIAIIDLLLAGIIGKNLRTQLLELASVSPSKIKKNK